MHLVNNPNEKFIVLNLRPPVTSCNVLPLHSTTLSALQYASGSRCVVLPVFSFWRSWPQSLDHVFEFPTGTLLTIHDINIILWNYTRLSYPLNVTQINVLDNNILILAHTIIREINYYIIIVIEWFWDVNIYENILSLHIMHGC